MKGKRPLLVNFQQKQKNTAFIIYVEITNVAFISWVGHKLAH